MADPIVISGFGLVLPGGIQDLPSLWEAVSGPRCVHAPQLESHYFDAPFPYGHVAASLQAQGRALIEHKLSRFASRVTQLSPLAIQRALDHARLDLSHDVIPERRGLYTVEGDYAIAFECAADAMGWTAAHEPAMFKDFLHACVSRRRLDVMGVVKSSWNNALLINSICWQTRATGAAFFAGVHGVIAAINQAQAALSEGLCDVALVATTDSFLDPYLLLELQALGWLAPSLQDARGQHAACAFDANSQGMVLSSASTAMVLERSADAQARGVSGLRLRDTHTRATRPESSEVQLPACDARWVIAQGTGVPGHDEAEARLIAARAPQAQGVTCARSKLGYAGSSSMVADLALAQCALHKRALPPMWPMSVPVTLELPWVQAGRSPQIGAQIMVAGRGFYGEWGSITVEQS